MERLLASKRITLFTGANRSGKTRFACYATARAAAGYYSWMPTPCEILFVSLSRDQAREATEAYFRRFLPFDERVISQKTTREGFTIFRELTNGSRLIARSEGQGWRMFQGAAAHMVVFDEEPSKDVYTECTMRMRADYQMKILFTFTPVMGITWVYTDLWARADKLGVGRITSTMWENGDPPCRTCGKGPGEAAKACVRCRGSGVEPRISREEIEEKETLFAGGVKAARLFGEWAVIGGTLMFSEEQLEAFRSDLAEGERLPDGLLRWEAPQPGMPYVLGVDCGLGIGGDASAVCIMNAVSGAQAALWADNVTKTEDLAGLIEELAQEYNGALVCVECPGPGLAVLDRLKDRPVWLYRQRWYDHAGNVQTEKIGWHSSFRARAKLIFSMNEDLRTRAIAVRDRDTWEELSHFCHNEKNGRFEAASGYHDDRVIALALACEARRSQGWARPVAKVAPDPLAEWLKTRFPRGSSVSPYPLRRSPWRGASGRPALAHLRGG